MKSLLFTVVLFVVFTGELFSQNTTIKLPTADSTSRYIVTDNNNKVLSQLYGNGEFYMLGTCNSGTSLPALGSGPRFMWDPYHAAFRAGYANGTQWDGGNIGYYSAATGYNTKASGTTATAMGYSTTASGFASTAMGISTIASGDYSTAMGDYDTASGQYSTAMGYSSIASGNTSIAMGNHTIANNNFTTSMGFYATASGLVSTAMGIHTTASGYASTASGFYTTASGNYSTAMGTTTSASGSSSTAIGNCVSTNNENGSCIIGDSSTSTVTNSSAANQMMMRFNGGYKLYSNSALTSGVYMNSGVNGWSNISDRNRKHNFSPVDGEELLRKIRTIPITEWSYKGTDPSIRYIGPMAQDFYAAFHLGGTDSLGINSISIDGVNMAAIQALEKRTAELQKATAKIAELEKQTSELQEARKKISALESSLDKLSAVVQTLVDEKKNVSMSVVESKEQ